MEEVNKKKGPSGIEYIEVTRQDNSIGYKLNNGIILDHIPESKDTGTNNLRPQNDICKTEAERKQLAIKAGRKSVEVRQEQKTFKELGEKWLKLKVNRQMIREVMPEEITDDQIKALADDGITLKDLIILSQSMQAISGNERAAVFVRDTIGEKPVDRQEITADVITDGDRQLIDKLCKRVNGDQE